MGELKLSARVLTAHQREVIVNLYMESPRGIAPMMFGGSNGSHHSGTATRLCNEDDPLVERRKRGMLWNDTRKPMRERGSYVYRLTGAGERYAEEYLGCHPAKSPYRERREAWQNDA